MKKTDIKNLVVVAAISIIPAVIIHNSYQNSFHNNQNGFISLVLCCITSLILFNLFIRSNFRFKPYFTNSFNLLTSKYTTKLESDLSKELLIDSLPGTMNNAGFKMLKTNYEKGDILATSSMTWLSWGENIYIHIEEMDDKTIIEFTSVCFQAYSWGKNETNFSNFMNQYEKTFTI